MGLGDDILATRDAWWAVRNHPERERVVAFGNGKWKHRHKSIIYKNNPQIATHVEQLDRLIWVPTYPKSRPYLASFKKGVKFVFNMQYKVEPGLIYLTDAEQYKAYELMLPFKDKPTIYIEPHGKATPFARNKMWGPKNWQHVVNALRKNVNFIQGGTQKLLDGCHRVASDDFRVAVAILEECDMFCGGEGGLAHAAAAVGTQSLIIWGGANTPITMGYGQNINIVADEANLLEPCGKMTDCSHCRALLNSIKPVVVIHRLCEVFRG